MKMIAFLVENRNKFDLAEEKVEDSGRKQPAFSKPAKLLYFLFAPTLLYRDDYPRTAK